MSNEIVKVEVLKLKTNTSENINKQRTIQLYKIAEHVNNLAGEVVRLTELNNQLIQTVKDFKESNN